MNQLILNNLPAPVLLVWGLPEDAELIGRMDDETYSYQSKNNGWGKFPLKCKDWQPIGKLSELTEGDCRELVKETALYKKLNVRPYRFTSYIDGFMGFQFALESFHSAIEAEGYLVVNPYSEPIYTTEHSDYCYCLNCEKETKRCADLQDKSRQAQSKTLPANTLIFKRL